MESMANNRNMNRTRYLFFILMQLSFCIITNAQIRTDYREGMTLPKKIDLINVAPKGFKKLMLEKHEESGYYRLSYWNLNDYDDEGIEAFIQLMNMETRKLVENVWGKDPLTQKKRFVENFLVSLGCVKDEGLIYSMIGDNRWTEDYLEDETDKGDYYTFPYPAEYDNILTEDDIKHRYFGVYWYKQELDLKEFIPSQINMNVCKLVRSGGIKGYYAIVIQMDDNIVNTYYMKYIPEAEHNRIGRFMTGNYPWLVKQNFICGILINQNIEAIKEQNQGWALYQIPVDTRNNDGRLAYTDAKRIQQPATQQPPQSFSLREILFEWAFKKSVPKDAPEEFKEKMRKEVFEPVNREIRNSKGGVNSELEIERHRAKENGEITIP